jgi:hypothetical protein
MMNLLFDYTPVQPAEVTLAALLLLLFARGGGALATSSD